MYNINPLELFERMSPEAQVRIFDRIVGSSGTIVSDTPAKSKSTSQQKISDEKITAIKRLSAEGKGTRTIMREVGVSESTVRRHRVSPVESIQREISDAEANQILDEVIPASI